MLIVPTVTRKTLKQVASSLVG